MTSPPAHMTDTTREAVEALVAWHDQQETAHLETSNHHLEAGRTGNLPAHYADQAAIHGNAAADLRLLLTRLSEMEGALEPFADIASLLEGLSEPDSINLFVRKGSGEMGARIRTVALADFRRARQALSSPDKGVSE